MATANIVYTEVPQGTHPMQGEGLIVETNQRFYFRHRGTKASLAISKTNEPAYNQASLNCAAFYSDEGVHSDNPFIELPAERVNALVLDWVNLYLSGS
ncbi:hypothetical protein BH10CYA1_BH10CYA1_47290 [soil metagenome]